MILERLTEIMINKVDEFEFRLRFGISPDSKNAQKMVTQTLKCKKKPSSENPNIFFSLAKKYDFIIPDNDKID